MSTMTIVIAVLVVLVVIAVGFMLAIVERYWHSRQLRSRFGPEYEHAVDSTGDRHRAESSLQQRVERRRELQIRELSQDARDRYTREWRGLQGRFVDDPRGAVEEADSLVSRVMTDRGYPEGDFEQHAADVSVDHAAAVPGYRSAHAVMLFGSRNLVAIDDLRQAMVQYRDLFTHLVGGPPDEIGIAGDSATGRHPQAERPADEQDVRDGPARAGRRGDR